MDVQKIYEIVEIARGTGKIKKGTNETTKALERGKAALIVYAEDITPPEIVMHLPLLAKEKGIDLVTVPSKDDLGKAAGVGRACASLAIVNAGEAKKQLEQLRKELKKEK